MDLIINVLDLKGAILALIDDVHNVRKSVYALGVMDYVICPIVADELIIRVKSCLALYSERNPQEHISRDYVKSNHITIDDDVENAGEKNTREVCLVQKTCQYLLNDLSSKHSLDELACKMATNRNKLSQASKNILGVGISSWLRNERMKKAKNLCISTDLPIQEICYQIGYGDHATFSTVFKKYYKMTPRECRNSEYF